MRERPILFDGPAVRAILDGCKTQTRRPVKHQRAAWRFAGIKDDCGYPVSRGRPSRGRLWAGFFLNPTSLAPGYFPGPYGCPGDRLWVRETWHTDTMPLERARAEHEDVMSASPIYYREHMEREGLADKAGFRWRPSIHMPRWASRIELDVTALRVERVKDISRDDAIEEGLPYTDLIEDGYWSGPAGQMSDMPEEAFMWAWDAIYAKRGLGWDANPWVWAITFQVREEAI